MRRSAGVLLWKKENNECFVLLTHFGGPYWENNDFGAWSIQKGLVEENEKILVNNFGSSEFFINKAIGWSLRDYSKTNQDWVRNFVETHKDKMDKLSIREASKYL